MTENLKACCAPGATFSEELISVDDRVSLRVITFTPSVLNNNPAVLFIPGWISQISGWQEVLFEMTKDFKVYYVETREKISSVIKNPAGFSVEEIGNDIVKITSRLKLENRKYILFGSSLGATAIMDCCINLKVNPLSLILVGPNAVFRIPGYWKIIIRFFYTPLYGFIKPIVKWYLKTFRLDAKSDYEQYEKYSGVLDAADPLKLKHAALAVSEYELWDKLSLIEYPALIIGASKDKLHEPENLKKIVSMMKNAEYLDLETNKKAHTGLVVTEMRKFISKSE